MATTTSPYYCPAGFGLGGIYGTGIYMDLSPVCTAATHAGLISPAAGGMVVIEMRPGQPSYTGTARNGVSSNGYSSWELAYVFVGPGQPIPATVTVGPGGAPVHGSGPLPPGFVVPVTVGPMPVTPTGVASGPCTNPRTQQVMDDWLGRAIPPLAGTWRYEPWGRAIGQGPGTTVTTPVGRPDTNLTRCEYLLQQAPGLRSTALGTLLDHLKSNGIF